MDSDFTSIVALRKLSSLPRRTHFHEEAAVSKVDFIKDTGGVTKSERGASCPCGQIRNSPQWLVVSQILPFLTLFWCPSPLPPSSKFSSFYTEQFSSPTCLSARTPHVFLTGPLADTSLSRNHPLWRGTAVVGHTIFRFQSR